MPEFEDKKWLTDLTALLSLDPCGTDTTYNRHRVRGKMFGIVSHCLSPKALTIL